MKKFKMLLVLILIILVIGGASIVTFIHNKIPKNPAGTVGNTPGNLYHDGLFCENEGKVYFSNPYDSNTLYVMNPDGTEIKKLSNIGASSINAANKFVYYYQSNTAEGTGLGYAIRTTGLFRMTKDGAKNECLLKAPIGSVTLVDNALYYQHFLDSGGLNLESIAIDKSKESIAIEGIVYPACAVNSVIYYSNSAENFSLYSYDTRTGANSMIWNHRVWNPIYHTDGYLYFMDIDTQYELHRYNIVTGDYQVLTTDRVENFNVYENCIYYQKFSQSDPVLMRMRTDGSFAEVVAYGNFENVNITSKYVYFNEFGSRVPIYRQDLYGPINPTIFSPLPYVE